MLLFDKKFNFIVSAIDPNSVLWYENYDIKSVITPVNVKVYKELLRQADYDESKTDYLVNGFTNGFDIQFKGE